MIIMIITLIKSVDYLDYHDYHMRSSHKYIYFNMLPINIAHRADPNDEWRGEGYC
jgi:hypothetical protein